jgi:hypothetical protein
MTIDSPIIDFDELETFERDGLLVGHGMADLHDELERQRRERARDERLAAQVARARTARAEREARAAVGRVVFQTDGGPGDALLCALRGLGANSPPLAVEHRGGRTVEFHAADCLAFVPGDVWERHGGDIREALRRAHPMVAGHPAAFVVREPGEGRDNLLELIGAEQPAKMMARETLLVNLARGIPACPTAARWHRAALDSHGPAAADVARAIHGTFARAHRVAELDREPARPARAAPAPIDLSFPR